MKTFFITILLILMVSCGGEDSGNTGNSGDTGNTGNTGNSGDSGDTGDTGNSGDSGNSGNELLSAVYSSGTRLKVRYIESPDGAKVFQGIYDSELKQFCGFSYFSDGKHRCFPYSSSCSIVETYFSDACKTLDYLVMCSKKLPVSKYVSFNESDLYLFIEGQFTIPIDEVFEIGTGYSGKTFGFSGETCVETTDVLNSSYRLFVFGNKVPFSTFQEGSIKTLE